MPAMITQPPASIEQASDEEIRPNSSPTTDYIWVSPGRMHGEPCFKGTRVPIRALFDHLRAGDGFGKFLEGYEGVTAEQVVAVIDLSAQGLLKRLGLL